MARGHITATHRQASYLDPRNCAICAQLDLERVASLESENNFKAAAATRVVEGMRSSGRTQAELEEAQKWVDQIQKAKGRELADHYRENLDRLVADPEGYARQWIRSLGPNEGKLENREQPTARDRVYLSITRDAIEPYERILAERLEQGL